MRWTIYFLVVLNLLVFTWFKFQQNYNVKAHQNQVEARQFDFSRAKTIQLASETGLGNRSDSVEKQPQLPQDNKPLHIAQEQCLLIGYFPEVISAREARMSLEDKGIYTHIVAKERELPAVSWVYIPSQGSREKALALLKELHVKKIDSFVVMEEGDDQFAISLGFFGNKESAMTVMKQRQAEGYKVEVAERIRKRPAYWLGLYEIQHSDREQMENRLENELKSMERVKKLNISCKELALLEVKH